MDANDMELASKQKELWGVVKDRISNLPDAIIHYILSFLPTKNAVSTSVLSTRWKDMWTSVHNLEFDEGIVDKDPANKMKFVRFVDRVLNIHDSKIKKFSIKCYNHDESRVNAWIDAALQHEVEDLNLSVHVEEPKAFIILPELICKTESLTVLKLESNCGLVIPTPFSLPNLKILHLHSIIYSSALSNHPLFLSCPSLSELILDKCPMNDFKAIIISIPSVKILRIYDTFRDSVMKIYAENLVSFVYIGGMSNDVCLCNTWSLVDAYVEVTPEYEPKEIGIRACKLLRQLSNVKFLAVTNVTISTLRSDANIYAYLPTFENLIHLELSTNVSLHHYGLLIALIQRSPFVEHLLFDKEILPRFFMDKNTSAERSVPTSFLPHLKSVEFKKFSGNKIELALMKILLYNVKALERMSIHSSEDALENGERHVGIRRMIDTFQKASCCSIDYF